MLSVDRLTKRFDGNTALDNVSFMLREGELTAVIGPNGAGKTTLLDVLSGLIVPDTGSVEVDGTTILQIRPWVRARQFLERTFQVVKLADSLSARENIMLHAREQAGSNVLASVLLRPRWREEQLRITRNADALLAGLALEEIAAQPAGTLSFGQRKAVSFCGATIASLDVVLLDEPFTGVDADRGRRIANGLRGLARKHRHVLFVEHNLGVVAQMASRVLALDRGRLIADGPPDAVLRSDRLVEAYLR